MKRCLKYQLNVDCERLTHDIVSKVSKILDPHNKFTKKNSICFPICSECFNEVCLEMSQLDKSHHHRRLRKLESTYIETMNFSPALKKPQLHSNKHSPIPHPSGKGRRRHFGSFQYIGIKPLFNIGPNLADSKIFAAAAQNSLQNVPAIEDLILEIEKLNLTDSLKIGIVEKVIEV